jgi:hypothetical protein
MTTDNETKPLRYVPIVTGLVWTGVAVALIFWNPEGVLYWVRNFLLLAQTSPRNKRHLTLPLIWQVSGLT